VTFVHVEKIGYGPEARTAALDGARRKLVSLMDADIAKAA
jgi:hypothetical protein